MANWDETAALMRDDYDIANGHGHGKVNQVLTLFPNYKCVYIFYLVQLIMVSYFFMQIVNDITARRDTHEHDGSRTDRDNPSTKKIWNVLDEMQKKICDVQKQVALIPDVLKCVQVTIISFFLTIQ